jgi:lysozyme family protein
MNNSFEPAFRALLDWEGGYVDHPDDPGGETKYGISKAAYPKLSISKLTKDRAKKIYRCDYWTPAGCDELPEGLDLIVFDGAVNCGVDQAVKMLQAVVGTTQDGVWGPNTKAATLRADARKVIWEYVARRAIYYTDLSVWDDFGLGWMRRLAEMHQQALKLVKA